MKNIIEYEELSRLFRAINSASYHLANMTKNSSSNPMTRAGHYKSFQRALINNDYCKYVSKNEASKEGKAQHAVLKVALKTYMKKCEALEELTSMPTVERLGALLLKGGTSTKRKPTKKATRAKRV